MSLSSKETRALVVLVGEQGQLRLLDVCAGVQEKPQALEFIRRSTGRGNLSTVTPSRNLQQRPFTLPENLSYKTQYDTIPEGYVSMIVQN